MSKNTEVQIKIQQILDENQLGDLQRFLNERKRLNSCNFYLIYLFHIFQSIGILTTTVATGYNNTEVIWMGIGFNFLASLINVIEKTNNNLSKRLLDDIDAIRQGNYIDEKELVEIKKDTDTEIKNPMIYTDNSNNV